MMRTLRIGLAMACFAAVGVVAYELIADMVRRGSGRLPEGGMTRYPQERPPFAEAAETGLD